MKNSIKKILNMLFALGCLACLMISIMDYIHDDMLHAIYALVFYIILENSKFETDDDDEDIVLRPISSMTQEDELELINKGLGYYVNGHEFRFVKKPELIDWLNKNMFDYRGLIEKGFAIEVTEPESPFKVGDKVVINCHEKFATLYNGKEGTIIDIFDLEKCQWGNIVVVLDNGMRNTFYASELIKK